MGILIGLIPSICWGLMPILVQKFGGRPISQLMGTVYGSAIMGLLIFLVLRPGIALSTFIWCFLGGMCWSLGQITQYISLAKMGVSITMPITTGVQLVGTSLAGVLFFGSWDTGHAKLAGFFAIAMIVLGVVMTSLHKNSDDSKHGINKSDFKVGLTATLLGGFGFVACNSLPKIPSAPCTEMILPQSLGMLSMGIILALIIPMYRKQKPFFNRVAMKNILTGLLMGVGQCTYFCAMNLDGLSTGFVLSQMCVVVSTFLGIFLMHEHKNHKELVATSLGLVLVIAGGAITSMI